MKLSAKQENVFNLVAI